MTATLPRTTREVRLAAIPEGLPTQEHFAVVETPLPEPGTGQVLVRNRYFLVFPGLRTLIGGEVDGLPLPPLRSGDTLFGPAVGEVVAASADSPLRTGDAVAHMLGWREFALVSAAECTPLDDALPDPVAHLAQGSAAYGALTRLADVRVGDVVFVTGAAGAVGSLAGQIARLLGARRVIGSTGSPEKAERLVSELGYDAVVLRGAGPFAAQVAEAAPEGIDVWWTPSPVSNWPRRSARPGRARASPWSELCRDNCRRSGRRQRAGGDRCLPSRGQGRLAAWIQRRGPP